MIIILFTDEILLRFPLFSRGVDTYRFEYGVFLLNKNIEFVCLFFALKCIVKYVPFVCSFFFS